ncbi:MAG: nucleotidyltransferase domain-containing protein [Candidatus Magasanikbacteria bacterium]|nr:nucleotidyltransferase domain-containing protein [Candidatus Magasanikbacteria bacterium]
MARKRIPKKIIKAVEAYAKSLQHDKVPVKNVYIFGSFAKGNPHEWSDIDVCVISPKFKDSWDALTYLWQKTPRITNAYEPHIEPVGYSPKVFKEGGMLIDEIKRYGVKIV